MSSRHKQWSLYAQRTWDTCVHAPPNLLQQAAVQAPIGAAVVRPALLVLLPHSPGIALWVLATERLTHCHLRRQIQVTRQGNVCEITVGAAPGFIHEVGAVALPQHRRAVLCVQWQRRQADWSHGQHLTVQEMCKSTMTHPQRLLVSCIAHDALATTQQHVRLSASNPRDTSVDYRSIAARWRGVDRVRLLRHACASVEERSSDT